MEDLEGVMLLEYLGSQGGANPPASAYLVIVFGYSVHSMNLFGQNDEFNSLVHNFILLCNLLL